MAKITYADKTTGDQFLAAEATEIKTSVNDLYDVVSAWHYSASTANVSIPSLVREVGAKADVVFTVSITEGTDTVTSQTITTPVGHTWVTDPDVLTEVDEEYAVKTDVAYTARVDDGTTVDTDTKTVEYVFPQFSGSSATILTGITIYTTLTKDITAIGNKSIAFSFTDEYAYFCFDADYVDSSIQILDGNGFDVTSSFTKYALTVDSGTFHAGATGGTDWTKSYDVYRTTAKTDISATYQFLNVTE